MELWTAFILGFAGSLHCAGMCGPLVLALPVPVRRADGRADRATAQPGTVSQPTAVARASGRFIAGRLLYHLGRVTTYCVLGLVFGLVGKSVALAGVQEWASLGLGMAILLGVLGARSYRLQRVASAPVGRLKSTLGYWLKRPSLLSPLVFGLLNGLLPCGLVYVACAGAVTMGSALGGVRYMAVFGLGTVPMMLGLGLASHWLQASFRLKFQKVVPACLLALAALLILRGLALGIPYLSPNLHAPGAGAGCPHCAAPR